MKRLATYLWITAWGGVIFAIPALIGGLERWWHMAVFGLVIGLCTACEEDGIDFIWHTPKIYKHAGLFLKVGNKRYRVFKVGKY